ncbi:MAG: hypothetical protein ISN28_14820 [Ectothiorhodospiraceae bacterium AqS1]|nr:hypothetical protein [Ectothiorhodospiraceae bacterium AqS1]
MDKKTLNRIKYAADVLKDLQEKQGHEAFHEAIEILLAAEAHHLSAEEIEKRSEFACEMAPRDFQ